MELKHDKKFIIASIKMIIKKVRISFALKIAIGKLNEVVSQIGMHQKTG